MDEKKVKGLSKKEIHRQTHRHRQHTVIARGKGEEGEGGRRQSGNTWSWKET